MRLECSELPLYSWQSLQLFGWKTEGHPHSLEPLFLGIIFSLRQEWKFVYRIHGILTGSCFKTTVKSTPTRVTTCLIPCSPVVKHVSSTLLSQKVLELYCINIWIKREQNTFPSEWQKLRGKFSWLTICHFTCVLLGKSGEYDTSIRISLKQKVCVFLAKNVENWKLSILRLNQRILMRCLKKER